MEGQADPDGVMSVHGRTALSLIRALYPRLRRDLQCFQEHSINTHPREPSVRLDSAGPLTNTFVEEALR